MISLSGKNQNIFVFFISFLLAAATVSIKPLYGMENEQITQRSTINAEELSLLAQYFFEVEKNKVQAKPKKRKSLGICKTCGKIFKRKGYLRDHKYTHADEKPFKCPFADCPHGSTQRSNLRAHLRSRHLVCCEVTFASKEEVNEHYQQNHAQARK